MPTYEVETSKGVFEIEVDAALPDGPEGERILQRLLQQQLQQQALPDPHAAPSWSDDAQAVLGLGKQAGTQLLGGVRESVQGLLHVPFDIADTIGQFVSPDPPGGPRRQLVPPLKNPVQLPDTTPPQSGWEKGVRFGGQALGDAAGAMLLPPVRHGVATLGRTLRPGPKVGKELMFDPSESARKIAARQMRKPQLDYEPGSPAAKGQRDGNSPLREQATPTKAEPTDLLKSPPTEGERNLAQLFGFEAEDIPAMSQQVALIRRQQLRHAVPDDATQQEGPLAALLQRLEQQILRYR